MASNSNLIEGIYNGRALDIEFFVTRDGSPADVTGMTFLFGIKSSPTDPVSEAKCVKRSGEGITILNASTGHVLVALESEDTASDVCPPETMLFTELIALSADFGRPYTVSCPKIKFTRPPFEDLPL